MTLTLRYAARSDRGLIREGNQDAVYAGPRLLAVADGMGGMAAGDVASNLAIAAMAPLDEDVPGDSLVDALRSAVDMANQNLRDAVDANPALEGMGTTLTGMLFSGTKIAMVHVGDSRAYLMRNGEFSQLTKDDTYVQMLVDDGRITEEEASVHPQRSLLIRALQGSDVDPQYSIRAAVPGDRYLICSDGLSGPVSDDSIAATMREYADPDECAERLVHLALRGGGPDNITVIIADVTDADIVEGRPVVGGAAARNSGTGAPATESTPATRASALNPPRPAAVADEADDEIDHPRRHPARTAVLLVLVLAVLGGGLWYGWSYTQSRYYVGATDDNHVAIFKGVQGQVIGLKLNRVYARSDLSLGDLTQVAQDRVKQGIPASSRVDAQNKLESLRSDDLKQVCLPPLPSSSPSAAPSPTKVAATSSSEAHPSDGPKVSARPSRSSSRPATAEPSPDTTTLPPSAPAVATPSPDSTDC
jgi:PPM family protein phosphatase